MALTRASSGLLLYDDFSTDTESNYTEAGGRSAQWSVTGGTFFYDGGGDSSQRRADISTAKCMTARAKQETMSDYVRYVGVGGSGLATGGAGSGWPLGYLLVGWNSATTVRIYRNTNSGFTQLLSAAWQSKSANTNYLWRIYISEGSVYGKHGTTTLGVNSGNAVDGTYTSGQIFIAGSIGDAYWDWLDARTSHLITCTGLPANSSIVCSDGTTTATANTSAGTASADCGAVLFPLASVTVYSQPNGAGTILEALDTGDYADMGGGDTYEYVAPITAVMGMLLRGVGP